MIVEGKTWFVEVQKFSRSEDRDAAFWLWITEITLEQNIFSFLYTIRCVYLHTCKWKRFVRVSSATYTEVFVSTLTRQLASSHKRSLLLTKPEKKRLLNSAANSGQYMLCLECNISVILTAPETLYLQIQMTVANSTLWKDSKSQLVTCLWIQHHKVLSKIKREIKKKGKCDQKHKLKQMIADQKYINSNENVLYYRH